MVVGQAGGLQNVGVAQPQPGLGQSRQVAEPAGRVPAQDRLVKRDEGQVTWLACWVARVATV